MDPDTTLAQLREALRELDTAVRAGNRDTMQDALATIAERASALDLWLVRGGYLPTREA
jgi:hypothetical protein